MSNFPSYFKWNFSEALVYNVYCESTNRGRGWLISQTEFVFYDAVSQRTCVLKNTLLLWVIMSLIWHCHCFKRFGSPLLKLTSRDNEPNTNKSVSLNYSYRICSFVPTPLFVLIFSAASIHLPVLHFLNHGELTVGANWILCENYLQKRHSKGQMKWL